MAECPICRDLKPADCPGCVISQEDVNNEMFRDVGEERPVTDCVKYGCQSMTIAACVCVDKFGYYPGCNEG